MTVPSPAEPFHWYDKRCPLQVAPSGQGLAKWFPEDIGMMPRRLHSESASTHALAQFDVRDIEGARSIPKNRLVRRIRNTNPLCPAYKLPNANYREPEAPPPKFLRNTLDTLDIAGTKAYSARACKPRHLSLDISDIKGASTASCAARRIGSQVSRPSSNYGGRSLSGGQATTGRESRVTGDDQLTSFKRNRVQEDSRLSKGVDHCERARPWTAGASLPAACDTHSGQSQACESPGQSAQGEGRDGAPASPSLQPGGCARTSYGLFLSGPSTGEETGGPVIESACGSQPSPEAAADSSAAYQGAQPQRQDVNFVGRGGRDAFPDARFSMQRVPPSRSPYNAVGPSYWFSMTSGVGRQTSFERPVGGSPNGCIWKPSRDPPARKSVPEPLVVVGSNPSRRTSNAASSSKASAKFPQRHGHSTSTADCAARDTALTPICETRRPQTSLCVRDRGASACAHCGNPGDAQESLLEGVWGATKYARPSLIPRPMTAPVQHSLDMYAASCRGALAPSASLRRERDQLASDVASVLRLGIL